MLSPDQQQTVVAQINHVEQQVDIIRRMIQQPDLCGDILRKLSEAEASLNRVSLSILKMHVDTCVPEGMRTSDEEGRTRLAELVDIFDRFAK